MTYTEEEAKTKWCPFARYQFAQYPASNRWKQSDPPEEPHALNPIPCRCIASSCMAWRTSAAIENLPVGMEPQGDGWEKSGPATGIGGATTHRQNWKRRVGFCGLAGQP